MCDLKKVLLVDDDLAIRTLYGVILPAAERSFPGEVIFLAAGTIQAAQQVIDAEKPDVVLLDLIIPPHNADDAVDFIRKVRAKWPPIVAITGHHEQHGYRRKCLRAGAQGYMWKDDIVKHPAWLMEKIYNAFLRGNPES